jgi:TolB protein
MTRNGAVAVVAPALLLSLASCEEAIGPGAAEPDRIIFLSDRDGAPLAERTIYRVAVDGTDLEVLVSEPAQYSQPVLSPDGTRLAFAAAFPGGCQNIRSMHVDGSDVRQLSGVDEESRCNVSPRWSPNGSRIAFMSSDQPELSWEVHVMNADGTGRVNVTNHPAADHLHGWTPDGRLVIESDRAGEVRTYVMNPDGTDVEPLFDDPGIRQPYWSPDGTRIAAVRQTDGESQVLMLTDAGEVAVEQDPSEYPTLPIGIDPWSPDGTRLAYVGGPVGPDHNIRIVNADGTGLRHATAEAGQHVFRGWSPDGTRIVFTSDRTGQRDVFVANDDGSGLVNLTNSAATDDWAIWVPAAR